MNRSLKFAGGLLFGALFGAGLVLLFVPRSGAETQRLIQEHIQAILAEGRQAAEERRLELTARFEALKQPDSNRETGSI
jgi:gas vesicle protein